MIRTQIYLAENQSKALKALAASTGRKQSELIREAMDAYLAHRQTPKTEDWKKGILKAAGMWEDHNTIDAMIAENRRGNGRASTHD